MRWARSILASRTATPHGVPSASGRVGLAGCRPRRDRTAATGAQQNSGGPTSRTVPGSPYHSLIGELGTLTMNKMQLAEGGSTFSLPTQPTPLQQRCFELLRVSPRM